MTAELRVIQTGMIAEAESEDLVADLAGTLAETGEGRTPFLSSLTSSIWWSSASPFWKFFSVSLGAMACDAWGVRRLVEGDMNIGRQKWD